MAVKKKVARKPRKKKVEVVNDPTPMTAFTPPEVPIDTDESSVNGFFVTAVVVAVVAVVLYALYALN